MAERKGGLAMIFEDAPQVRFLMDSPPQMVGLVAAQERRQSLKERAKLRGPQARVARFTLDQMDGRVVRPL